MTVKIAITTAFAVICLTAIATTPVNAQNTGSSNSTAATADQGTASANPPMGTYSIPTDLTEAEQYDLRLARDPAFRQAEIETHCGPIVDPDLKAACVRDFEEVAAAYSSGIAPRKRIASRSSGHHPTHYVGSSAAPKHYKSSSGK